MTSSQLRYYRSNFNAVYDQPRDFLEIVHSISPLTRVGALCFIFGKLVGILALPAAFIPSLNILVVPLVIIWGGMVLTAICLCSVDHYRKQENESEHQQNSATETHVQPECDEIAEIGTVVIPLTVTRQ